MDRARQEKPAEAFAGEGMSGFRTWEGRCGSSAEGMWQAEAAWVRVWALESQFRSVDPSLTAPMCVALSNFLTVPKLWFAPL